MVSMLSTIVSSSKIEATKVLDVFKDYKMLWEDVRSYTSCNKYFELYMLAKSWICCIF